jgi:hypothetical protein
LKEAKAYLEQEKMRLEAELAQRELRLEEMGKIVADGATRIAELGKKIKYFSLYCAVLRIRTIFD